VCTRRDDVIARCYETTSLKVSDCVDVTSAGPVDDDGVDPSAAAAGRRVAMCAETESSCTARRYIAPQ